METKSTVNQRFIKAVNYLISVKSAKNKTELAFNLRLGKSKLSEILNERMNVGIDTIALFCLLYEIRADWLLNERGKMIREGEFIPKSADGKEIYFENIDSSVDQEKLLKKEIEQLKETNELLRFKVSALEKQLTEFRYNSQKEPVLYRNVAETAPELIKKKK